MGLYLAIFDGDDEIDGVEVGMYSDFGVFRDAVVKHVEDGIAGSECPTLILHSDCDGEWSSAQSVELENELRRVEAVFQNLPPDMPKDGWKAEVARSLGLKASNLYDCFFDVDGEPLVERLLGLARKSRERSLPILFQ